jgi:hypothetical protein
MSYERSEQLEVCSGMKQAMHTGTQDGTCIYI